MVKFSKTFTVIYNFLQRSSRLDLDDVLTMDVKFIPQLILRTYTQIDLSRYRGLNINLRFCRSASRVFGSFPEKNFRCALDNIRLVPPRTVKIKVIGCPNHWAANVVQELCVLRHRWFGKGIVKGISVYVVRKPRWQALTPSRLYQTSLLNFILSTDTRNFNYHRFHGTQSMREELFITPKAERVNDFTQTDNDLFMRCYLKCLHKYVDPINSLPLQFGRPFLVFIIAYLVKNSHVMPITLFIDIDGCELCKILAASAATFCRNVLLEFQYFTREDISNGARFCRKYDLFRCRRQEDMNRPVICLMTPVLLSESGEKDSVAVLLSCKP